MMKQRWQHREPDQRGREQGNAGQTAYSMAKAGLIGLTKSLARELGSRNYPVNAVSPGWIRDGHDEGLAGGGEEAMAEGAALARRDGAEVAEAIAFLRRTGRRHHGRGAPGERGLYM